MIDALALTLAGNTEIETPRSLADTVRGTVLGVFGFGRMTRVLQAGDGVPRVFVPMLRGCLTSRETDVRCGGAVELGNLGSAARSALPALETALEREQDEHTRNQIQFAIGSIRADL